jgi:hypothetical protein
MNEMLGPGRQPLAGMAATGRNQLLPEGPGLQERSVSVELEVNGTDGPLSEGVYQRRQNIGRGEAVVRALREAGLPTAPYYSDYAQTENVPGGGVDVGAVTHDYTARGHEITIPVMRGDAGIEGVKTMVRVVKSISGAKQGPQQSAGIHVHIGTRDLTPDQKRNICSLYGNNDGLIDSMVAPSRRRASWGGAGTTICDIGHGGARINIAESHGTYEFRRLGSNINGEFVGSWSQMLMYMVQYAKDHSGEMPTFSRLSDFLDELGLPESTKATLLRRAERVATQAA